MDFNRYFNNEELEEQLTAWVQAYPRLISIRSIGESYEKRPIWITIVTNQETGADLDKPAIWVDANIHATEIAGTTTALRIIDTLLSGYGTDERITHMLDSSVFYVVPRINPDGAAQAMAERPHYIRSGVRFYPWPEKEEGLHEEDMDGDGRILQMRIPDPNGDWKISSLDSRMMEKRDPTESGGQYYRLIPEGRLEGFDGFLVQIAPAQQGLDFNRNFPFQWRPEDEQKGAGPYPTSEPEIRALADFISNHPNINVALTFHTYSRVILRPYSTKADEEMETEDLWVYKKLGQIGTQLTGYRSVSTFHDFKYHPKEITTGGFDDWLYDHFGMFTFTIELWDLPTAAGIKERKFIEWFRDHPHEEDLQILKWVDENADPGGYVDWYSFDHPQLGPLELGGWNEMYTWRNPPPAWMGAESASTAPFALALADLLPHLSVHTLAVTPLGDSKYHINLVVENSGYFPTFTSQRGKTRKAIRPVRVELELPENARLLNGKRRVQLGHLEGRSNKLDLTAVGGESPTDNRARAEWALQAESGSQVTLTIVSERAGKIVQTVVLP
jgi:murein tripeptide amidase MpaA